MKVCSRCKKEKEKELFYKMKDSWVGIRPSCKDCDKKAKEEYAEDNPVMDRCKKMGHQIIKRTVYDVDSPVNRTYKENNVKSKIGDTGVEIAEYLYSNFYDDILNLIKEGEKPSVDRIDSTKDYEEGNIRIISFRENSLDGIRNAVKKTSKETKVMYPNGDIRMFKSVSEASRELGIKRDTIIRNRDNGTETRNGFRFE